GSARLAVAHGARPDRARPFLRRRGAAEARRPAVLRAHGLQLPARAGRVRESHGASHALARAPRRPRPHPRHLDARVDRPRRRAPSRLHRRDLAESRAATRSTAAVSTWRRRTKPSTSASPTCASTSCAISECCSWSPRFSGSRGGKVIRSCPRLYEEGPQGAHVSKLERFLRQCRVTKGTSFRLKDHSPGDTAHLDADKTQARALLQRDVERLATLQDKLYAQDRWAILLIFQAMDAAGKDGTIKHVMSGVNPQGCQVYSFKVPSAEDLDHDFLWRSAKCLPERGRIGVFNRSYYEEVLVVRVHPELLERQEIPPRLVTKDVWNDRYESIA